MTIRTWPIYLLLALTLIGVLLLSVFWEFYLEDLVVPYIYRYYHPEPLYERVEYLFVSVIFATIALILPGWIAIHSYRRSGRAMQLLVKAHAEVEQRVQERTAELQAANQKLVSALETQRETEAALRNSVADLKQLSSRLLVLQEDEKQSLAAELHDSVSQTLSALKFRLEHILPQNGVGNGGVATGIRTELLPTIQGAIDDVRSIYMELRPTLLDDFGLATTLNWLSVEFRKKCPRIQVESDIGLDEDAIPKNLKLVIFRVLQEGFKNISRHSHASLARYALHKSDDSLDFILQDNGIGFDVAETLSAGDPHRATGLSTMRAQVERTMGLFRIESAKGTGVKICASWPTGTVQAA